nr:unnamed protein product [Digitaria exilis]
MGMRGSSSSAPPAPLVASAVGGGRRGDVEIFNGRCVARPRGNVAAGRLVTWASARARGAVRGAWGLSLENCRGR